MEKIKKSIRVDVIFASACFQSVLEVCLPIGSTVKDAIIYSGILEIFSEINLNIYDVGIFSARCHLDDLLEDKDQVEIYRPLSCDPKQARRQRAKMSKL